MPRPKTPPTSETFGQRLARLRKARGFTQTELGQVIGLSQRMMTYYERQNAWPPAHLLPPLAEALAVSLDELMGLRPAPDAPPPRRSRLWRKLREIEKLPRRDQQALLRTIEAFLSKAS
jgi:transcriptional regulator with XRE-family HTH domain